MNQFPLWLKPRWWAGGATAPRLRAPGNPEPDAEQRWENEGGNPPMTEPPGAPPRKHL